MDNKENEEMADYFLKMSLDVAGYCDKKVEEFGNNKLKALAFYSLIKKVANNNLDNIMSQSKDDNEFRILTKFTDKLEDSFVVVPREKYKKYYDKI